MSAEDATPEFTPEQQLDFLVAFLVGYFLGYPRPEWRRPFTGARRRRQSLTIFADYLEENFVPELAEDPIAPALSALIDTARGYAANGLPPNERGLPSSARVVLTQAAARAGTSGT